MDDDATRRERERNQRIDDLEVRVTKLEGMITNMVGLRADKAGANPPPLPCTCKHFRTVKISATCEDCGGSCPDER
jgi:hypothetical protein